MSRAETAKKQLGPQWVWTYASYTTQCPHTWRPIDKTREAMRSCYYLPSYLRILVSPFGSRPKRPRLDTEVQDSAATDLLPTTTLHTGCLSDSGVCTAESTPLVKLRCTSVASPQLLRNAFDVHVRSEGNSARYNSTLLKHHVQLAAVNSHVDQPTAPQDLARSDL